MGAERTNVMSVGEFLEAARSLLEGRFPQVAVKGEVANFKTAPSGHMYFSLKDDKGRVDCAFFRGFNQALAFKVVDGLEVVVGGTAGIYEARGQFQISVRWMEPAGLGAQQLAFEQLKKKLGEEGLFDPARKRPLPKYPRRVAVVTSSEGAAWQDFLRILSTRVGIETVELFDARVQGAEAVRDITAALGRIAENPVFDVVVVTRGGGSAEDLAAFNDERVVRAVAGCPLPVVSAVGHEIDTTLCDFAADKRAPTPTAAAEWLAPDREEITRLLEEQGRRLRDALRFALSARRESADGLMERLCLLHPRRRLDESRQLVDSKSDDLVLALRNARSFAAQRLASAASSLSAQAPKARLEAFRERLSSRATSLAHGAAQAVLLGRSRMKEAAARLDALHPHAPLKRGYALVTRKSDGGLVSSVSQASKGDGVDILLSDGKLDAEIKGRSDVEPL